MEKEHQGDWFQALKIFVKETIRNLREYKRGLFIFFGLCFLALIVLGIFAYKVVETSWFCGICHNMAPYVASWKASKHRDVPCVKCHYKPGLINHLKGKWKDGQLSLVYFITGKVITKPHAEIDDESCTQCHPREKLKDLIVYKNVLFSHKKHLGELRRGKKLRCTTCHSQIVQGKHITVTEVNCFICHFYGGEKAESATAKCGICHFAPKGRIVKKGVEFNHEKYISRNIPCETCHTNVIKGDGHVVSNPCIQCHNKREILEASYTPQFIHENHVTNHKIECFYCHTAIEHKIQPVGLKAIESKECSKCHGKGIHEKVLSIYRGKGGYEVEEIPSRMAELNLDCGICHKEHGGRAEVQKSCEECHGPSVKKMLKNWDNEIEKKAQYVFNRIFEVKKIISTGTNRTKKAQRLLEKAIYNYNLVEMANGVHNPIFAMSLLNSSLNMLEMAIASVKKDYKPKYTTYEVSCLKLCHVDIMDKVVPFGSLTFPHDAHAEDDTSCKDCHSSYEAHGKTWLLNCKQCHHGEGEGNVKCIDCHKKVYNMYVGKGGIGVSEKANPMHGDVTCKDCHTGVVEKGKDSLKMVKKQCSDCHGEDMSGTLDKWLMSERSTYKNLSVKIRKIEREMSLLERTSPHLNPLRKILDRIEKNYELLKDGKMVHNFEFSKEIISKIEKDIGVLKDMIDAKRKGKIIQIEM